MTHWSNAFVSDRFDQPEYSEKHSVRYLIVTTVADGDIQLSQMLCATGLAGVPGQYANKTIMKAYFNDRASQHGSHLSDYFNFLEKNRTTPNGVFGSVAHLYQMKSPYWSKFEHGVMDAKVLEHFFIPPDVKVVLVIDKDDANHIWRAAEWILSNKLGQYICHEDPAFGDGADFKRMVKHNEYNCQTVEQAFEAQKNKQEMSEYFALGRDVLVVDRHNIASNSQEMINNVIEYILGRKVDVPSLQTPVGGWPRAFYNIPQHSAVAAEYHFRR
jgi:hypothetical protein